MTRPPDRSVDLDGTVVRVYLSTPDVATSARFYRRVLGWTTAVTEDCPTGGALTALVPAGPVARITRLATGQPDRTSGWLVMLGASDLDAVLARAVRCGGEILDRPPPEGEVRSAVIRDAGGGVVGLIRGGVVADASVQRRPGAMTWADLESRDLTTSRRFYADLLGWSADEGPGGYWTFRRGGTATAGLRPVRAEVPADVPGYWLAYFAVANVEAACAAAREAGGAADPPAAVGGMRCAVIRDPFGAVFATLESPVGPGDPD